MNSIQKKKNQIDHMVGDFAIKTKKLIIESGDSDKIMAKWEKTNDWCER